MHDIYKITTNPKALKENIIQGECFRITMLTEGLLRLEYDKSGVFVDQATQMVLSREFMPVDYRVIDKEDQIEVITKRLHLIYNKKEFSKNGLSIQLLGNLSAYHSIWRYGEEVQDLKGTARTLDLIDGEVELENGLISRFGYSVIDDSKSLLLAEDGFVAPREKGNKDIYFFGYGHDYQQCFNDFNQLCGKTPMLPRYALGNWWSRFYKYTEDSYMELMDQFKEEEIPFTVAVIDMDWHIVDIDPKYGSGWTGFTWNKKLFPDPKRFLHKLHERGMRTTLNIHPADGIRAFEDAYPDMARELGVDVKQEDPVVFDIADPKFIESYFKYAHHPHEEIGVDFWWVDWQQGANSKFEGLDPLWMLNHYHYLDHQRNGKRPMIFSRYAGPGSHRYPIGFSGDSITTWKSLEFQPYFTANASNIGYGWWSHDIGGHMLGYKNDEMMARWVQFGVFSPIMRLHSSSSIFNGKEPWRFKAETQKVMGEFLRLRHRMMPYLYTMNYKSFKENRPILIPMYYDNAEDKEAYEVSGQYYFGDQLITAPITSPRIPSLNRAKIKVWLPEGTYIDIFTGMIYRGSRFIEMYRDLNTIPVLAKAGGILPLTDDISSKQAVSNPENIRLQMFAGKDGAFTLYEDDNESCNYEKGESVLTNISFRWENKEVVTIDTSIGNLSLIPKERGYTIELVGCKNNLFTAEVDGKKIEIEQSYETKKNTICLQLPKQDVTKVIKIICKEPMEMAQNNIMEHVFDFLNQAEIDFVLKDELYHLIENTPNQIDIVTQMQAMNLDREVFGILLELITAY